MFQIFKPGTTFDIVGKQKVMVFISFVAVIASLLLVATRGLNYGIDFKGGSDIILSFKQDIDSQQVREALERVGVTDPAVQRYGEAQQNQFLVQTSDVSIVNEALSERIAQRIKEVAPIPERGWSWSLEQPDRLDVELSNEVEPSEIDEAVESLGLKDVEVERADTGTGNNYVVRFQDFRSFVSQGLKKELPERFDPETGIDRIETVGARVGNQLREDGITSLLLSLLAILIYIAVRFDVRYAPGAVLALFHDVIISLGIIALTGMEVNLTTLASILTIVGYSLNDTIVVFDRIRENYTAGRGGSTLSEIVNTSLNETLNRTVITSLTTFLAVIVIVWLGSGLIQSFAQTLLIGIVVGTYSSIFIASPVLLVMDRWVQNQQEAKRLRQRQASTIAPSPEA